MLFGSHRCLRFLFVPAAMHGECCSDVYQAAYVRVSAQACRMPRLNNPSRSSGGLWPSSPSRP